MGVHTSTITDRRGHKESDMDREEEKEMSKLDSSASSDSFVLDVKIEEEDWAPGEFRCDKSHIATIDEERINQILKYTYLCLTPMAKNYLKVIEGLRKSQVGMHFEQKGKQKKLSLQLMSAEQTEFMNTCCEKAEEFFNLGLDKDPFFLFIVIGKIPHGSVFCNKGKTLTKKEVRREERRKRNKGQSRIASSCSIPTSNVITGEEKDCSKPKKDDPVTAFKEKTEKMFKVYRFLTENKSEMEEVIRFVDPQKKTCLLTIFRSKECERWVRVLKELSKYISISGKIKGAPPDISDVCICACLDTLVANKLKTLNPTKTLRGCKCSHCGVNIGEIVQTTTCTTTTVTTTTTSRSIECPGETEDGSGFSFELPQKICFGPIATPNPNQNGDASVSSGSNTPFSTQIGNKEDLMLVHQMTGEEDADSALNRLVKSKLSLGIGDCEDVTENKQLSLTISSNTAVSSSGDYLQTSSKVTNIPVEVEVTAKEGATFKSTELQKVLDALESHKLTSNDFERLTGNATGKRTNVKLKAKVTMTFGKNKKGMTTTSTNEVTEFSYDETGEVTLGKGTTSQDIQEYYDNFHKCNEDSNSNNNKDPVILLFDRKSQTEMPFDHDDYISLGEDIPEVEMSPRGEHLIRQKIRLNIPMSFD